MKLEYFNIGKKKAVSIYLANDEDETIYKELISTLVTTHRVCIFGFGKQDIKSTIVKFIQSC